MSVLPWTEKYRPNTLENYIFPEDFSENDINYIKTVCERGYLDQNLLLFGKGGTGKTTLAKILLNAIIKSPRDYKYIKGRTISEIDELKEWIPRKPYASKQKLVIIEEADRISDKAYAELKSIIEDANTYHKTYFILLTNKLDKIISRDEAFTQRFYILKFTRVPKDKVLQFAKYILSKENIEFDEENLYKFIEYAYNNYWSLRKIIHTLQVSSVNGKFNFIVPEDYTEQPVYTSGTDIENIISNNIKAFINLLFLIEKQEIISELLFTTDINLIPQKFPNELAIIQLVEYYREIKNLLLENYKIINYNKLFTELEDLFENILFKRILTKYQQSIEFARDKVISILSMLYEFILLRYELIQTSNQTLLTSIKKELEDIKTLLNQH